MKAILLQYLHMCDSAEIERRKQAEEVSAVLLLFAKRIASTNAVFI